MKTYSDSDIKKLLKRKEYFSRKKALDLGLQHEIIDYYLIFKKNKKCFYCGNSLNPSEIEFDHYIPLSSGGSHTKNNIKISCQSCNRLKRNYNPYYFFNYEKKHHQFKIYELLKSYMEDKSCLYLLQEVQPFIQFSKTFTKQMKDRKHVNELIQNHYFKASEINFFNTARKFGQTIKKPVKFKQLYKTSKKCFYCDSQVPILDLKFDTLIPFYLGGKYNKNNIVVSCSHCITLQEQLLSPDIGRIDTAFDYYKTLLLYRNEFKRIKKIKVLSSLNKDYIKTLESRLPKPSIKFKKFILQFNNVYTKYCFNKNLYRINIEEYQEKRKCQGALSIYSGVYKNKKISAATNY